MIPSMNHINQTVRSQRPDTPDTRKHDFCDRRRSSTSTKSSILFLNDEEQYRDGNLRMKQSLRDEQPWPTNENKSKEKQRQIGEADKEDEKEQQYRAAMDSLGPYDVICGRGSLAFNNIGNRRFRVLISMNVDEYNNSQGRHRKGLFIGSLVDTLQHQVGVRFFKLKGGQLIELTDRQIRQKVGHALRDVLAFQESQQKQQQQIQKQQQQRQQQIRKQHQEQEHESQFNTARTSNHARSTSPAIAKARPWNRKPTPSRLSPSEATLSSIRTRLREIRTENDTIRLQRHSIPPPLPFGHSAVPQQIFRNTTTSRSTNGLSKRQFLSEPNYLSSASNSEELRQNSGSRSSTALFHEHNKQNHSSQQPPFTWNGSANATFESSTSHHHINNINNLQHSNHNSQNNHHFHQQERDISETFAGMDLAPIPLEQHHEPDDEAIRMLHPSMIQTNTTTTSTSIDSFFGGDGGVQ